MSQDVTAVVDSIRSLIRGVVVEVVEKEFSETVAKLVVDQVEKVVSGGGIHEMIEERIGNYDFSESIDSAVDTALRDYDFSSDISDAVSDYDFSRDIDSALGDHDFSRDIENAVEEHDFSSDVEAVLENNGYVTKDEVGELVGSAVREVLANANIRIDV